MNQSDSESPPPVDVDSASVAEHIDRMMQSFLDGQPVDLEVYCERFPELAGEFREMYPTMLALAQFDVGLSSEPSSHFGSATELLPRFDLGDFQIVRQIGRGGMGIVYEAIQSSLNRRVALKTLPFTAVLDDRQLQRFKNEARAAAMLTHPNIVRVHAIGCEQGVHFYAMELIHGHSLATIINSLKIASDGKTGSTPDRSESDADEASETMAIASLSTEYSSDRREFAFSVARIGVQAALALEYAHATGIVHRDIKPSNLLLNSEGQLFVADFGLARVHAGDDLTASGDFLGTLRYMSPEQIDSSTIADPRTDVYSLGVTLREVLTGEPAITGPSREIMIRNVLDGKLNPVTSNHAIPRDLQTILVKATNREPADRYQTAEQLANDLRNFLEHRPIIAQPPSRLVNLRRWTRRNPRIATLSTVIAALLFLIAGLAVTVALNLQESSKQQAKLIVNLQEQDADRVLHATQMALQAEDYGLAMATFDSIAQKHPHRIGSFEYRYLKNEIDKLRNVPTSQNWINRFEVCFAPDGSQVITTGFVGEVTLLDAKTQKSIWSVDRDSEFGHKSLVTSAAFSVDGRYVFSAGRDRDGEGHVKAWNRTDGSFVCQDYLPFHTPYSIAVSPDGTQLAVGVKESQDDNESTTVFLYHIHQDGDGLSIELADKLHPPGESVRNLDYSVHGRYLAAATLVNRPVVWDTETMAVVQVEGVAAGETATVAFSPTSDTTLAFGINYRGSTLDGSEVVADDLGSGERVTIIRSPRHIQSAQWSRDGTMLGVAGIGKSVDVIDVKRKQLLKRFRGHSSRVNDVSFSPDGKTIASSSDDGAVRFYNLEAGALFNRLVLANNSDSPLTVSHSPDANRIISGYYQLPRLVEWNLLAGERKLWPEVPVLNVWAVDFSNDGQHVLYCGGNWPASESTVGTVRMLDAESHKEAQVFLTEPNVTIFDASFVPPDQKLVAATTPSSVRLWDRKTGKAIKEFSDQGPKSAGGAIKRISFDATGDLLAAAYYGSERENEDAAVVVWNVRTEEKVFSRYGSSNFAVALSGDGELLATGLDEEISIYRLTGGMQIATLHEHTGNTYSLQFSNDGSRLISAGRNGSMYLWNTNTWNRVLSFNLGTWIQSARFSPDEKMITAGTAGDSDDGIIHIFRAP